MTGYVLVLSCCLSNAMHGQNPNINRGRYVPASVCRGKATRGEAACRGGHGLASHAVLATRPSGGHSQYKFICVCLCVCAVTLSVNSPTSQTHQRIVTVDSLKDADLRKDVPFGGLDDE